MGVITLLSKSERQTEDFAAALSKKFSGGEILLLYGGLGAGKTRFTKGIAKGLNIKDIVTSPTFAIMHQYSGRLNLYHMDMYRIESENELYETGFFDALEDKKGVTVIEWPQNIIKALPAGAIKININIIDGNTREITVLE